MIKNRKTHELHIRVDPLVAAYLDRLIKTGLYGSSHHEVARNLVLEGLRKAAASKLLTLGTAADEKGGAR